MATRAPVHRVVNRRVIEPAAPVRPRKRRFRRLRRLIVFGIVLGLAFLLGRAYVLHVYAPGLRSEAASIPARVHSGLAQQNETYIPGSEISPNMERAIVAIEDRRFYHHPGIDPLSLLRAFWVNVTHQHVDEGGSTLEQQLAKRAITQDDRTIHNKLRTMAIAWAIDQDFTKSQIIELYLNAAYYGRGAYGVGAAARVYFATDPAHLTLSQAAFLAAMPQAPSIYGAHPLAPNVIGRKNRVLADMEYMGYITPSEELAAQQAPLTFAFQPS